MAREIERKLLVEELPGDLDAWSVDGVWSRATWRSPTRPRSGSGARATTRG